MRKKDLRIYYLCLGICLMVSLIENIGLWMIVNPLFSLISIYFYYKYRKSDFQPKDSFFSIALLCSAIQEVFLALRPEKWSLLIGIFFLFLMFFFFILTIQQEKPFLLFGRKNMLFKSILIIFSAIVCYVGLFLPVVPDYLIFPIFIHVFVVFFSFLISANRTTNSISYNYVIGGMLMFVSTTVVAGISLFIYEFGLSYFLERLCFMLGVSFITLGILNSNWINAKDKVANKVSNKSSMVSQI